MKEIITMTPQELRNHIKECEVILQRKEEERFYNLVNDVVNAAQKLLDEFPNTILITDPYCENCEERVDMQIDIDYLVDKDNYREY